MELNRAEKLFVKHFNATLGRRFYVWLGLGLVNWVLDEVYGHYLEIPENAKLWLHPFRITLDEPKFRRNSPDMVHGLIINMLTTSYKEETGENPNTALNTNLTRKAIGVRSEYLTMFPVPEKD